MGFYEFINEMKKILEEKHFNYKKTWRELTIDELRTKMNKQLEDISTIIMSGVGYNKKKVRRKLVHVANYCFFIHQRMEEMEMCENYISIKDREKKHILFYLRKDKYGWLSNFERAKQTIIVNGFRSFDYDTNEHWYQSQKAIEVEIWHWIKNAPNPFLAMKAGRSLRKKEMVRNWEEAKVGVMLQGLRAKFSQNEELKKKLLATGKTTLHENSPTDMFWGIKGKDMLGKLLMQVREELKNK